MAGRNKDKNRELEKKAVVLNSVSLLACIVMAISAPMFTLLVLSLAFAVIEAVHFVFGDITTSYRLAAKSFFKWFSLVIAIVFFGFIVMALFGGFPSIFFFAIFIAWLTDQNSNCIRLKKKNNKIKGLISLFRKK